VIHGDWKKVIHGDCEEQEKSEEPEMTIGIWQGVAMDSLKFYPVPPCPALLCPVGGPPLKRPYGRFRVGPSLVGPPAAVLHPLDTRRRPPMEMAKRLMLLNPAAAFSFGPAIGTFRVRH
jgi:hypothetical protein